MVKLYDLKFNSNIDDYANLDLKNILDKKKIKYNKNDLTLLKKNLNSLRYIVNLLTQTSLNSGLKKDKNYLKKIIKNINSNCNINLTKNECFNILSYLIKNKKYVEPLKIDKKSLKKIYKNKKYKKIIITPEIDQNGGSLIKAFFNRPDTQSEFESALDFILLGLDLGSFIPGSGLFLDFANVIISIFRKRWYDAIWSAVNIIPIFGSFIGVPGKYITKILRYNIKNNPELFNLGNKNLNSTPNNQVLNDQQEGEEEIEEGVEEEVEVEEE